MRIDIITVLPEMIEGALHTSILKRSQEKGLAQFELHNLRDYTLDKHRRVDDYPFGGEAGMVLQIEPIDRAISHLKAERNYDEVIFTTPDGEQFTQSIANELSLKQNIIILCGHYKGIDYRVREHLITREISIGDFVLTGGELAAAMIADAVVRLIPGVIGDEQSALSDSFQDGLLAPPVYTRLPSTRGGGCLKCCFQDMNERFRNGVWSSWWNALDVCVPICRDMVDNIYVLLTTFTARIVTRD